MHVCKDVTEKIPSQTFMHRLQSFKCIDCDIPVLKSDTFSNDAEFSGIDLSNNGIKSISKIALPKLKYLYLQHNQISSIEPGAFTNMFNLSEVNLDHNQLVHLKPGVLKGLQSFNIILSNNHLQEIPDNLFEQKYSVMALNLSFNQISTLNRHSFRGLDNLEILDLQQNKICYIPLGLFEHIMGLKDLNLKGNVLRSFESGTFSGLTNLYSINLASNDFFEFDPTSLLPLESIALLDVSKNNLITLDSYAVHINAPTLSIINIYDNLWSCPLLQSMVRYFRTVNIVIARTEAARYDITNINGISEIALEAFQRNKKNTDVPMVAEMSSFAEKLEIMRNTAKLDKDKIYIEDDLTKDVQRIQIAVKNIKKRKRKRYKNKKRRKQKDMVKQIEENYNKPDVRMCDKEVGNVKKNYQPKTKICQGDLLERWKEHYQEIMEESEEQDNDRKDEEVENKQKKK
ncbi:hypothetical protein FQA39_LY08528 [Lamprigera yunnana]|nr:hypothetical protein FQA39_LY08528 [Lamprigera yunnana]